jgi:hypothetical protein
MKLKQLDLDLVEIPTYTSMLEDYTIYQWDDPCDDCTHWIGLI